MMCVLVCILYHVYFSMYIILYHVYIRMYIGNSISTYVLCITWQWYVYMLAYTIYIHTSIACIHTYVYACYIYIHTSTYTYIRLYMLSYTIYIHTSIACIDTIARCMYIQYTYIRDIIYNTHTNIWYLCYLYIIYNIHIYTCYHIQYTYIIYNIHIYVISYTIHILIYGICVIYMLSYTIYILICGICVYVLYMVYVWYIHDVCACMICFYMHGTAYSIHTNIHMVCILYCIMCILVYILVSTWYNIIYILSHTIWCTLIYAPYRYIHDIHLHVWYVCTCMIRLTIYVLIDTSCVYHIPYTY